MNGSLFPLKIGICMGPLSNSQQHIPTKTKLEYPLWANTTTHKNTLTSLPLSDYIKFSGCVVHFCKMSGLIRMHKNSMPSSEDLNTLFV